MKALEVDTHVVVPDLRVAVCGDWHGNQSWLRAMTPAICRLAPDVTTVMQLGDWWMDPRASDDIFAAAGITRVYVTLGNHEPWSEITPLLDAHPGAAVRVSEVTWLLPRPARLQIGGRAVLSLGGAASVDRYLREEGVSWWPDEAVTDEQVEAAIEGDSVDLMLTHESPAGTPVSSVREVLRTNPLGFPDQMRAESAVSQARVGFVWDTLRPELLIHGHMHSPGGGATEDGRRVASLGCDAQQGNLAFLDLDTLRLTTPSLRELREAAERP